MSCFEVNTPTVVHDDFQEEIVIINLVSGNYYTLNSSGSEVWRQLSKGFSPESITTSWLDAQPGDPTDIRTAVEGLVARLLEEGLIRPRPDSPAPAENGTPADTRAGNFKAFEAPVLERYTDMQELLLLDPIHEVSDLGWPSAARPESSDS